MTISQDAHAIIVPADMVSCGTKDVARLQYFDMFVEAVGRPERDQTRQFPGPRTPLRGTNEACESGAFAPNRTRRADWRA